MRDYAGFLQIRSHLLGISTQENASTQANMSLAVSLPKQLSPVPTPEVTISFGDKDLT